MAWTATSDPFEALGLERDADSKSIKVRYHQLARRYHPNRNQGSDEGKAALSDYFYHIHEAWRLLRDPDKRRRCRELLELLDQQEALLVLVGDLVESNEQHEQYGDHRRSTLDGHISSDADEDDIPRIAGVRRRQTFDQIRKRSTGKLENIVEGSDSSEQSAWRKGYGRSRVSQLRGKARSGRDDESSDNANTAAERRRKFDKLRRKELETFTQYRDAMVDKFEAEAEAEKYKEQFEQAKWRREYFERAPRETSQRVRLVHLFNTARKALMSQKPAIKSDRRTSVTFAGPILTPVEPPETNQFLKPLARTKTVHRRGYSSDISGDQTSSDENSSEKATSPKGSPRAVSPRPYPRKHRRLGSLPVTTRSLPNGNHDPVSPVTGPGPKLLIRAPTNLNEMDNGQLSDAGSVEASSRSPSPQPVRSHSRQFVLSSATSAPEAFDIDQDRRSRSPGLDHRSLSRSGAGLGIHTPLPEPCLFQIKQVGQLHHHSIPMDHVHELTFAEKQWMLYVEPDADMDPDSLLKDLAKLDEKVAALFMVKPDIKASFKFRLIYNRREVVKHQHQTFIALSYRRKLHVEKKYHKHGGRHYTLPLEPEMFQAVWDERLSETEGVWIDQICIDGDSEEEKTISMSAMDMVYRSARLVVVALDDIELEAHEGTILESHMEDFERQTHISANKRFRRKPTPYLESHDDLFMVIRKMMRSSWFRRAWCRHEMRLAREHIFLVPCRTPGSWSGKSVLRFTGKCLTHFLGLATEVPFEPSIEAVKPALYAFFRDRSKLPAHEHGMRAHHGNFTTVVAEVFDMEAGGDPRIPEEQRAADARKDKISIILNTMECGLALEPRARNPKISLPTHECNYMLLLFALAARDPGALGSVGHPLRSLPYNLLSSWLFEPSNVDSGLNNYRTLNRLPESSPITTHYQKGNHFVQLALKFLKSGQPSRAQDSPEIMALAERFTAECEKRGLGRNRKRYIVTDRAANHLFGSMREVYIETLVCVLECGPDWMSDVCQRYGVSRWRHDLQPAYELLIALKNTCGRWPESVWTNQATGFIADFVNFLIIRGMPRRQITQPEKWRPVWVSTIDNGKILTFTPPGDTQVAIPAALLDPDYVHLARMWVLEPRGHGESQSASSEWTLLGKSVLFSDDISDDLIESDNGMIEEGQKVFGRKVASTMLKVNTDLAKSI